ncbi:MAG: alpha/beta hydrolase [Flavisolibacter sp.]
MKIIKMPFFLILLLTTILRTGAQNNSTSISSSEKKPTIVFVHGLWADGSCWTTVINTLQSEGYEVVSTQNPTTSLENDVAATKSAIDRTHGPVILVGHSWGGIVITEAGNDPRVVGLVFVAAFAPDLGETPVDLLGMAAPNDLSKFFQVSNGFITLSKEGIKKAFAGDLPIKQQLQLYAAQTPASQSVFGAKISQTAWKEKPSWYIVARNDKAINPDLERLLAKRMKATTIEVQSSHVVMLSKPQEVLKMIHAAARYKY